MSERNPGAFPNPAKGAYGHDGMTLRDWFAGQAIAVAIEAMRREPAWDPEKSLKLAAKGAYYIADAMLAERSKGCAQ